MTYPYPMQEQEAIMNNSEKKILEIVRDHNERGEKIYWKKLAEILKGVISKPGISEKIRQLENDGKIEVEFVTGKQGTFKYLYIPEVHVKEDDGEISGE
ncbi:MAG: hypothetical protein FWD37_04915 [Methanomassiliicoccaceae archaeon]|nr:hypothetical protein [Methanomassiliicoccaceae archaeon]